MYLGNGNSNRLQHCTLHPRISQGKVDEKPFFVWCKTQVWYRYQPCFFQQNQSSQWLAIWIPTIPLGLWPIPMKYPQWLIHSKTWPGPRLIASPCRWALQLGAEFRSVFCGADQVRTYSDPPTNFSRFLTNRCCKFVSEGFLWSILGNTLVQRGMDGFLSWGILSRFYGLPERW